MMYPDQEFTTKEIIKHLQYGYKYLHPKSMLIAMRD